MLEATEFLKALGKTQVTFQTFSDKEQYKHITKLRRIYHGDLNQHLDTLKSLNKHHAGIYFMVNNGDLQGRKAENVQSVSSYFADLDGTPLESDYPLLPTAIVESSQGRYQIYWRIKDAPLETFTHVQENLAKTLNSDESVKDLPRVMRVPCFYHMKEAPQKVTLLALAEESYTHAEFIEAFNIPPYIEKKHIPLPQAAQDFLSKKRRYSNAGINQYNGIGGNTTAVLRAPNGQRNITLFKQAAAVRNDIAKGLISESEAYQELYAAGCLIGLNDSEINQTINSAWRYGEVN